MTVDDEKIADALARLDAREDPPPPPVLPPQDIRTVYDARLVVEQVLESGKPPQIRWHVYEGGQKKDPSDGLGNIISRAATLVVGSGRESGGWHPLWYKACRNLIDAVAQIQRTQPRVPPAEKTS